MMSYQGKYKPEQEVMIENFLVNGTRMDISANVVRYLYNKINKTWEVEVIVNGTYITLKEERLQDSTDFWRIKNGRD